MHSDQTTENGRTGKIRLNRFLSESGFASRREADETIFSGQVTVNGAVVRLPAFQVDPDRDSVKVLGRRLRRQALTYVLLNKPEGVVSTAEDPEHRRTVVDLLQGVRARVYPVGRLDINTSGVMLLTNDGDLALHLTHPRYGFPKTYQAKVNDVPSPGEVRKLAAGVGIPGEDGRFEKTLPARVRLLRTFDRNSLLELTVTEGRQHLVRKMLAAIGHPVIKLTRVRFGFLGTAGLPLGRWRYLTAGEVRRLKTWTPQPLAPARQPRPPRRERQRSLKRRA
jgi:23S rRNA pseudouridine2605 synthase